MVSIKLSSKDQGKNIINLFSKFNFLDKQQNWKIVKAKEGTQR